MANALDSIVIAVSNGLDTLLGVKRASAPPLQSPAAPNGTKLIGGGAAKVATSPASPVRDTVRDETRRRGVSVEKPLYGENRKQGYQPSKSDLAVMAAAHTQVDDASTNQAFNYVGMGTNLIIPGSGKVITGAVGAVESVGFAVLDVFNDDKQDPYFVFGVDRSKVLGARENTGGNIGEAAPERVGGNFGRAGSNNLQNDTDTGDSDSWNMPEPVTPVVGALVSPALVSPAIAFNRLPAPPLPQGSGVVFGGVAVSPLFADAYPTGIVAGPAPLGLKPLPVSALFPWSSGGGVPLWTPPAPAREIETPPSVVDTTPELVTPSIGNAGTRGTFSIGLSILRAPAFGSDAADY